MSFYMALVMALREPSHDMSDLIVKGKNLYAGNFGILSAFLRVEAAA